MVSPVRRFRRLSDLSALNVTPRRVSKTSPMRFTKPGAGRGLSMGGLLISSPHDEYSSTRKNPGEPTCFPRGRRAAYRRQPPPPPPPGRPPPPPPRGPPPPPPPLRWGWGLARRARSVGATLLMVRPPVKRIFRQNVLYFTTLCPYTVVRPTQQKLLRDIPRG